MAGLTFLEGLVNSICTTTIYLYCGGGKYLFIYIAEEAKIYEAKISQIFSEEDLRGEDFVLYYYTCNNAFTVIIENGSAILIIIY